MSSDTGEKPCTPATVELDYRLREDYLVYQVVNNDQVQDPRSYMPSNANEKSILMLKLYHPDAIRRTT